MNVWKLVDFFFCSLSFLLEDKTNYLSNFWSQSTALGHFISFHTHIGENAHPELAVGGSTRQAGSEGDSSGERKRERKRAHMSVTETEYFFFLLLMDSNCVGECGGRTETTAQLVIFFIFHSSCMCSS